MDLIFRIEDDFYQKLVTANVHNHAIPSKDGVKPDYTEEEWLFEYYKKMFLSEVNLYENQNRQPLPKPDPGKITRVSLTENIKGDLIS
jgi:hypothetical protein